MQPIRENVERLMPARDRFQPPVRIRHATSQARGGTANRLAAPRLRSSDVVSGTNQQLPWLSRQPDVVGRAWILYDWLMPRALHPGLQVFIQKQK